MTTQHTPAPWSVEIDHHTAAPEFIRAYVDGEMYDLASVLCDETGNATANARLIAAAPDLLIALREAVEIIEGTGLDATTQREAIIKATGESK
jgi:hypothetical protein